MKIISWNINGYRSVSGQNPSRKYNTVTKENKLFPFIEKENPDIICLQETKADPEQIDENLRVPPGYYANYSSCLVKKGYSGVVTFSKIMPAKTSIGIGVERFDNEGRIMETDFGDFTLMNIYFPKGEAESERLQYKLEFYDALFIYLKKHIKNKRKIIICGDYNTAHKEIDLAHPKENINTSGFMPIEREKLDIFFDMGFIDTFREFNSEGGHYSWWSARGSSREKNIGWRIDYHCVSENLKNSLTSAYIMPDVHGSDHCPVVVELDN